MNQQIAFSVPEIFADYSNLSTPSFTSSSNMSSPSMIVSSLRSSAPDSPFNCLKVGLAMAASLNDEAASDQTTFGLIRKTKTILFRHDVKFHSSSSTSSNVIFNVDYVVRFEKSPSIRVTDTVYGPGENPSIRRIVDVILPCILASSDNIRLYIAGGGLGQIAICTKHGNVGALNLHQIESNEEYTCKIQHHPQPKLSHMYNQCVLIFSPDELKYFREKNEKQPSSPFKLNNCIVNKRPCLDDKFLKFCMTCDTLLEGIDTYMYRGDASFCSEECRDRKMEADERKEMMMMMMRGAGRT